MLSDELSDLAIFAAVADARSFTRAAAKLGKSQSALSQSVRRLGERLKLRLLRGTRPPRNPPPFRRRAATVPCSSRHDEAAPLELTYNWDPEPYIGGRNSGHLAYAVDSIYDTCNAFIARGVTINRPPRDGRMALIRTPDGISIELLQAGSSLPPAEPWASMPNTGSW
jgi:lactoylglutathione lyase